MSTDIDKRAKAAMSFLKEVSGGPLSVAMALESHRKCEGWSQAELAMRLGVSRSYINAIEKSRKLVSPAQAARLGELFGTGPDMWVALALEDRLRTDGLSYTVTLTRKSA